MRTIKLVFSFGLLLFALSCGNGNEKYYDQIKINESDNVLGNTNNLPSSSAAVENKSDTTHKFIRTADLKFRAKSVIQSTYNIEDVVNRHGGFVTYTNLQSHIDNVAITAISADSSLETTYYTVTNTMILRVPNTKLDTTLKEMSKNIDFLDFRLIKAEDVALQILSQTLAQKRAAKSEERITTAIDERSEKLEKTLTAEEVLVNKQAQADNAMISKLSLADQINFSTVNLSIYQRQTIKRELISNNKNIDAYEPSFGTKLIESFAFGWNAVEEFLLFLVKIWELFLLGLIIFIVYKKYGYKLKE